jgi:ADP-ribosyl-[dinitrogen reductase] hydrolase
MDRYERILGGLFGVACGDALGGTLEFMSKDWIVNTFLYNFYSVAFDNLYSTGVM